MIEHQSQATHKWGNEGEREGGAHAVHIILIIMRVSLCCNCSFHDINAFSSRKGMHLRRQRLNVERTEARGWDNSRVPVKCGVFSQEIRSSTCEHLARGQSQEIASHWSQLLFSAVLLATRAPTNLRAFVSVLSNKTQPCFSVLLSQSRPH